jgi:hypothetical protein
MTSSGSTDEMSIRMINLALALLLCTSVPGCGPGSSNLAPPRSPATLANLLALSPAELSRVDIAHMNMLCTEGLDGSDSNDLELLNQLDVWAPHVKAETERHLYRYQRNPAEFEHSEEFFRMLMLAVVLTEDYRVHYHPGLRAQPGSEASNDVFFRDPKAVFLTGVLGKERQGTCSSLPVLFVAVGRLLGYPLKLVTTKAHLFVRWEGQQERFNVEVTGNGLNRFSDDYYRHWPMAVAKEEESAERHLASLSPGGELALFLSIRAMCLRADGRMAEAGDAFGVAARLAPEVRSYGLMEARCRNMSRSAVHKVITLSGGS